jgi:hypothetical protein
MDAQLVERKKVKVAGARRISCPPAPECDRWLGGVDFSDILCSTNPSIFCTVCIITCGALSALCTVL